MKYLFTIFLFLFLHSCSTADAEDTASKHMMNSELVKYGTFRMENDEVVCYVSDYPSSGISCMPKVSSGLK